MNRVIGKIYQTDDYGMFKRLPDNRDVLEKRVRKLVASISEKYLTNPIIVNENMEIIDGQGRYEALKHLGKPIDYIVVHGAGSEDCKRMNRFNTKWSTLDFAKSFAKAGNKAYITLLRGVNATNLPIGTVLRLANHGTKAGGTSYAMSKFEKGLLDFTDLDYDKVIRVHKAADEITYALQTTHRRNDAFYTAVKIITETENYSHDKMLRNCAALRSSYNQMSALKDQLVEFERIYNYRTSGDKKLYFSDYLRGKGAAVRDYGKTYSPYDDTDISTLK